MGGGAEPGGASPLPDIKWVEVQSQVEQARSVEQIAAKNLRDCRLYAPYDGVIAAKNVEVGQNVVPGLSGLSAGDEVIVEGQQKVCNGTPVILEDEDKK